MNPAAPGATPTPSECIEDSSAPGVGCGDLVRPGVGGDDVSSVRIGTLPLNECYFIGEDHAGLKAKAGQILILHVPTRDVWIMETNKYFPRTLHMTRIIFGDSVPEFMEAQVEALLSDAEARCRGLRPVVQGSGIAQTDQPIVRSVGV